MRQELDINKEYKLDMKKQRKFAIIIIFLTIALLIYTVRGINATRYGKAEYYYLLVTYFMILLPVLHIQSFTDIKLIIDNEKVSIFSIFQIEPTEVFLWNDIKSIQFGKMYSDINRSKKYRMKITYLEKKREVESCAYHKISIKRFQDYEDLIRDIEEIGKLKNIEVFYMNDN